VDLSYIFWLIYQVLSLAVVLASLDILFIQNAYISTVTKGASVQVSDTVTQGKDDFCSRLAHIG
jgi:hypothetical protein